MRLKLLTVGDTIHPMNVDGSYITIQNWDGGRTLITIRTKKGGKRTRVIHLAQAWIMDLTYPTRKKKKNGS
jgi:hypothetical protein